MNEWLYYYKLIGDQQLLKHKINLTRENLSKMYHLNNQKLFIALDILLIIGVLFNFGAVFLTNMLVMKNAPAEENHIFKEINPIQAAQNDLVLHDNGYSLYFMFLKQAAIWAVLIYFYWHGRVRVFDNKSMILHTIICTSLFVILGYDFFNDFGYYVGVLLYG